MLNAILKAAAFDDFLILLEESLETRSSTPTWSIVGESHWFVAVAVIFQYNIDAFNWPLKYNFGNVSFAAAFLCCQVLF